MAFAGVAKTAAIHALTLIHLMNKSKRDGKQHRIGAYVGNVAQCAGTLPPMWL
jgi:hypothetical protein